MLSLDQHIFLPDGPETAPSGAPLDVLAVPQRENAMAHGPSGHRNTPRQQQGKKQSKVTKNGEISNETQWMLRVRDHRDKIAFGQLFDHFAPRLKGMIMRSGCSSAQAEDILQEVMLKVWRKAHLYDPARAQVSAWIYQIARNQQTDLFRKEARPMPEALKTPDQPEPDASHVVALDQEVAHLRRAMDNLSPDQRSMVEKAYLGELSHSEISEATGLPLGTIKSRIRLALEKLRHEMKGARP